LGDPKTDVMDLVELQFLENALSARISEMNKLEGHAGLQGVRKELEESKGRYDEKESSYHQLETKRKKLEDVLEINEEKIKSNEHKLFSGTITDSKELYNYQNEIEMLKKGNSRMEDEILELMEEQEVLEPARENLKKELTELEARVKRIEAEIEEKREVLRHNIEGLKKRKEDVLARIPGDDLKRFNETKMRKGGIALSVIKDNFCGVCNMEIPAIEAEKFVDCDTLYNCPVCGRLCVLYRPQIDEIKRELE